jgi:hypothetical protein
MRTYRLTNEPGGLGLSCTAAGLSLAGTPLLRRTEAGFALRSEAEMASLMKAAYDADGDAARLQSSLQAIARALNSGELARRDRRGSDTDAGTEPGRGAASCRGQR